MMRAMLADRLAPLGWSEVIVFLAIVLGSIELCSRIFRTTRGRALMMLFGCFFALLLALSLDRAIRH